MWRVPRLRKAQTLILLFMCVVKKRQEKPEYSFTTGTYLRSYVAADIFLPLEEIK